MEATLSLAPDEQRIGLLFIQQEPSFSVYDSFCGNYKQATNIAIQEHAKLQKLSNLIEPTYELPSYLIKPVQRVCKYPLLINELIKNTDSKKYPFMDELEAGLDAIKRVTQNVNEQKRLEENREIKNDLVDQIEDLKFGDLLLHDKFPMVLGNVERDYTLFLFERIMLCCKEVIKKKKKKGKDEITTYSLKGNIYITSIGGVVDTSRPELQVFGLQVFWKDGQDMETFALNCRNIEQVKLWMGRLEKLVDMERNRRKSVLDGSYTTINRMFKAGDNDEQDVDDYDANYQPSSRSRGRSDAYNTSDAASAAAKLFGVRTDDNYRTSIDRHSSNSNSRPSNVYQDIPANPAVPEEYRNRKSAPAQPRPDQYSRTSSNGYSIEARGPSIDRNQNEGQYYAHRSSSQRQSSKPPKAPHYEDIISNLIHTQNISSPVPPTKKFEQINTSYNTRTASDSSNQVISPESLKYPGQNSSRSSNTQTSEYRTSADARLQARLQQLRSSDPIDPSGLSLQLSQSPSAPDLSSSGAPPNLPLPATPKSPPRQGQSSLVKVKTHYGSDIFVVAVSAKGCAYVELLTKIERKIRLCGSELPVDRSIRMRFRDINGDFIAIQNDRDVEFAFQNALSIAGREMGVINLFVQ